MFCRLVMLLLCLLNCVTEITEVTEGRTHFARGLHVAQPCFRQLMNLLLTAYRSYACGSRVLANILPHRNEGNFFMCFGKLHIRN